MTRAADRCIKHDRKAAELAALRCRWWSEAESEARSWSDEMLDIQINLMVDSHYYASSSERNRIRLWTAFDEKELRRARAVGGSR